MAKKMKYLVKTPALAAQLNEAAKNLAKAEGMPFYDSVEEFRPHLVFGKRVTEMRSDYWVEKMRRKGYFEAIPNPTGKDESLIIVDDWLESKNGVLDPVSGVAIDLTGGTDILPEDWDDQGENES